MKEIIIKPIKNVVEFLNDNHIPNGDKFEIINEIDDNETLVQLGTKTNDEWIKFEIAVKCKNKSLLKGLIKHSKNYAIILEAALELKDENALSDLAITCEEEYYGSLAIGYVDNKYLLKKITEKAKKERIRVEAALKLGDINLITKLTDDIKNEWYIYQLAASINHIEKLKNLAMHAENTRIKNLSSEWLEDLVLRNNEHYKLLKNSIYN